VACRGLEALEQVERQPWTTALAIHSLNSCGR
jgi:hypothetical protein